jgi:hypothetical protein
MGHIINLLWHCDYAYWHAHERGHSFDDIATEEVLRTGA